MAVCTSRAAHMFRNVRIFKIRLPTLMHQKKFRGMFILNFEMEKIRFYLLHLKLNIENCIKNNWVGIKVYDFFSSVVIVFWNE